MIVDLGINIGYLNYDVITVYAVLDDYQTIGGSRTADQ